MILSRASSTGSSGFRPTVPTMPHMACASSGRPLAEGHARDLLPRGLLFPEASQEEAVEREVRGEHRVPGEPRQATVEDRVLDRDPALAPEAHVDDVETMMAEQTLLHRVAVVSALVEHPLVVARLHPVGIGVRTMELLDVAPVAPGHGETDDPARLEHARDLVHGRDVTVPRDVLDDRDREDAVERAVLVREPLGVLRLHEIAFPAGAQPAR